MRAFLCLFPDPDSALAIERWATQCWPYIERLVPGQNLHITLAFLGDIDRSKQNIVTELISEGNLGKSFSMSLDKVGYWPQPQVLWLGSENPPQEIGVLAGKCRRIANRAGIRVGGKRFEPHITLARKPSMPPQAPLLSPSFSAHFNALQLCESFLDRRGARYVVREERELAPDLKMGG